jgi:glycosyltransferase involved in cell wall biosynthesis
MASVPATTAASRAAEGRVLFVGAFLSQSGGRRAVAEDLAERLPALGWTPLLTSRRRGRASRVADMLWTAASRRREYDVAHVDVFSGDAFAWAEAAAWVLGACGRPWVATLRGGALPDFAARRAGRVRRLLARARAVAAPSRYLEREMSAYRADIRVVPNAIDVARYPFRLRAKPSPRIVWLRAFHAMYRPADAPRALARLAGEFPDARLTMIGPDKGDGSLDATRRAAAELGVADRLEIVPGVPKAEVPERLSRADVFLNTTGVDNVPVSLVEALACGLCVVTTSAGGIPDLVRDGHTALLAPPDDPDALAAAVRRALAEPGLAARLSAGARRDAEAFDWSRVLPMWDALLREGARP